ncbi:MAG: cyclic nucleotide-binding domain-containing protein [Clostridium lundense]|nr:cyclic nucleotide-binding domain-containing protein [Clostridium lundense]
MSENGRMTCQKGDIIFREGAYGSCIYRVISGGVAVYAKYGTADEKLLTELHEGDYFGEMAVIEIARRSATVVATEDGTLLSEIDASDLSGYLEEHAGEMNGIARHLSRRLRELTLDYTEVCDTLRELGRLDTSADRVSEGLLERIRKFARVYLMGQKLSDEVAEPTPCAVEQDMDRGLALHGMEYGRGDVIFREKDRSDCMYFVVEGKVGVYTGYGTDKQKLLSELTSGSFFGEMGLVEGRRRTATVVALENDTFLESVSEKDLDVIYEKNPEMALLLLQHLSSRLRKLTTDYLKACKTLSETEKELEERRKSVSPEMLQRAAYLNQLMLAPEMLY